MHENQFEAKICEIERPIKCGPNDSCEMRLIKVIDDDGVTYTATMWSKKSEELHVGSKVLIGILPPVNPLSKIKDYEVMNTQ